MKDENDHTRDSDVGAPSSAADPDVKEAVDDLLIGICARLSFDDLPPPSQDPPSEPETLVRDAAPSAPEAEESEEDWGDDRPTPEIRYAIPPPAPESESGRVTDPDILSQALVYSDSLDDDEPRISVTSMLDQIEVGMLDGVPLSLRPTARTSFPPPMDPDRRTHRFWLALGALTVAALGSVWWLSRNEASAFEETSVAAPAEAMPTRQGVAARSKTKGAHVFVDGDDRGALPVVLNDLTPGKHELRFEAPQHVAVTRTMVVTAGQVVDLGDVTLVPKRERIRVELTPSNAYLQLMHTESKDSQRFAGPWPRVLELAPGQYDVMAFRGGYRTWAMRLRVEPGLEQLITWRIELPADDIYAD